MAKCKVSTESAVKGLKYFYMKTKSTTYMGQLPDLKWTENSSTFTKVHNYVMLRRAKLSNPYM